MADIVLFHSVLGVRQGVLGAATRMEAMGHAVQVPRLYDEVFDDYEPAMQHVQSLGGVPALMQRSRDAVAPLPERVVYAGFSNGGLSAEYLAATRPGAHGLVLFASGGPLSWFSDLDTSAATEWPRGVPVQVHYTEHDPFRDPPEVFDEFRRSVEAAGARFELHEYPGEGHLFTDASLPREYDAASTELLWERVAAFLRTLG